MLKKGISTLCIACGLIGGLAPTLASADSARAVLSGYAGVPSVSSTGTGRFSAEIDTVSKTISYQMTYSGLEGEIQLAHIHIGQARTNGGISAFLCSNAPNPPAGTPVCPIEGTVTGVIQESSVVGPTAQGIAPGEFAELVAAIRAGATYVNVHTSKVPSGEIRGQIRYTRN